MEFMRRSCGNNLKCFPVVFDEKVFGATRNEVFYALAKENIFIH